MKTIEGKKFLKDLQSKKVSWKDLEVPEWLINNLTGVQLKYEKPSIIQANAIPEIMKNRDQNYIFQSKNGSGKTGAFAIPSVMTVDPNLNDYQVIIIAHSRELINQIAGNLEILVKGSQVSVSIGDKSNK